MHDHLDLERYPLDRPESPAWNALIARGRASLAREGLFNLDQLVRPAAVRRILSEIAEPMATAAFHHARRHNVYFEPDPPGVPAGHPVRRELTTANHTICGDQIPDSLLTRLYEWAPLRQLFAALLDKPALYLMDDPLARINVMTYADGQALNWHFDRSEFTVTLLLQAAASGGAFQYRRDLRTADDPNHDGVARVLNGEDSAVQTLPLAPGTFNVFKGVNTLHRVTPVAGPQPRRIAVLSYYERPGVHFSVAERQGFYGRSESLTPAPGH